MDFLKFIGITCIIIAHVGAPDIIAMIRNFDVVLLVILSSVLAERSIRKYDGGTKSILHYYFHRAKRLLIPTWVFLAFFFVFSFFFEGELRSVKYYISSFCLTRYGIDYVWVILIYLYSAFLIPLFRRFKLSFKVCCAVVLVYLAFEFLYFFSIGANNKLLDTTVFYIIPYGSVTFLGFHYTHFSRKNKIILTVLFAVIFLLLGVYYWYTTSSLQSVQIAKYPPRLYYLSYGIACSFTLMILCERFDLKFFKNRFIVFVSRHSMWIYLWHILVIKVYEGLQLPQIWVLKLFVVYGLALLITFLVNLLLDLIEKKRKFGFLKYLRG